MTVWRRGLELERLPPPTGQNEEEKKEEGAREEGRDKQRGKGVENKEVVLGRRRLMAVVDKPGAPPDDPRERVYNTVFSQALGEKPNLGKVVGVVPVAEVASRLLREPKDKRQHRKDEREEWRRNREIWETLRKYMEFLERMDFEKEGDKILERLGRIFVVDTLGVLVPSLQGNFMAMAENLARSDADIGRLAEKIAKKVALPPERIIGFSLLMEAAKKRVMVGEDREKAIKEALDLAIYLAQGPSRDRALRRLGDRVLEDMLRVAEDSDPTHYVALQLVISNSVFNQILRIGTGCGESPSPLAVGITGSLGYGLVKKAVEDEIHFSPPPPPPGKDLEGPYCHPMLPSSVLKFVGKNVSLPRGLLELLEEYSGGIDELMEVFFGRVAVRLDQDPDEGVVALLFLVFAIEGIEENQSGLPGGVAIRRALAKCAGNVFKNLLSAVVKMRAEDTSETRGRGVPEEACLTPQQIVIAATAIINAAWKNLEHFGEQFLPQTLSLFGEYLDTMGKEAKGVFSFLEPVLNSIADLIERMMLEANNDPFLSQTAEELKKCLAKAWSILHNRTVEREEEARDALDFFERVIVPLIRCFPVGYRTPCGYDEKSVAGRNAEIIQEFPFPSLASDLYPFHPAAASLGLGLGYLSRFDVVLALLGEVLNGLRGVALQELLKAVAYRDREAAQHRLETVSSNVSEKNPISSPVLEEVREASNLRVEDLLRRTRVHRTLLADMVEQLKGLLTEMGCSWNVVFPSSGQVDLSIVKKVLVTDGREKIPPVAEIEAIMEEAKRLSPPNPDLLLTLKKIFENSRLLGRARQLPPSKVKAFLDGKPVASGGGEEGVPPDEELVRFVREITRACVEQNILPNTVFRRSGIDLDPNGRRELTPEEKSHLFCTALGCFPHLLRMLEEEIGPRIAKALKEIPRHVIETVAGIYPSSFPLPPEELPDDVREVMEQIPMQDFYALNPPLALAVVGGGILGELKEILNKYQGGGVIREIEVKGDMKRVQYLNLALKRLLEAMRGI